MIRVYIHAPLKEIPYLPLLYPNLGFQKQGGILFLSGAFKHFVSPFVALADDPQDAGFILIPHNLSYLGNKFSYVADYVKTAQKFNKPLIIFRYGDSDEAVDIPNSIIFRTSQYGYKKNKNEIILPAYVEDLADGQGINLRAKNGEKPVIGFCGWAEFSGSSEAARAYIKKTYIVTKALLLRRPELLAHEKGIILRKRVIQKIKNSNKVLPNFIVRKSYSHHKNTIELDPARAREEYIGNILNSDFSLAIKGDGNYSLRFYEILSLARIPFLINTDCVLPLEKFISYKDFVISIGYDDIYGIDHKIADLYRGLSSEEFLRMQKMARENFEKYLRIDSFFNFVFRDKERLNQVLES